MKTVSFYELFTAMPKFLETIYSDDDAKYCEFDAGLNLFDPITLVNHQQYSYESEENQLNGYLYQIIDGCYASSTYFILFTDKNSSTNGGIISDGMCVVQLEGKYEIGQEIPIKSIGAIFKIYCGHPSVINHNTGWYYSHGESNEPNPPDPDSDNLLDQLLEACYRLESTVSKVMNRCKENQSDDQSSDNQSSDESNK